MRFKARWLIWVLVLALLVFILLLSRPPVPPAAPPEVVVEVFIEPEISYHFARQEGISKADVEAGLGSVEWKKLARIGFDETTIVVQGFVNEDLEDLRVREIVSRALSSPASVEWPEGALAIGEGIAEFTLGPQKRGSLVNLAYKLKARLSPMEIQTHPPISIPVAIRKLPAPVEYPSPFSQSGRGSVITGAASLLLILFLTWHAIKTHKKHKLPSHRHKPIPRLEFRPVNNAPR